MWLPCWGGDSSWLYLILVLRIISYPSSPSIHYGLYLFVYHISTPLLPFHTLHIRICTCKSHFHPAPLRASPYFRCPSPFPDCCRYPTTSKACAPLYVFPACESGRSTTLDVPQIRCTNGKIRLWKRLTLVDVFLVCAARCRKQHKQRFHGEPGRECHAAFLIRFRAASRL